MKQLTIFALVLTVFLGCQKRAETEHLVWKSGQDKSALARIEMVDQKTLKEIFYHGDKIQHLQQQQDGLLVEGSSIKKILNPDNELEFAEAHFFSKDTFDKMPKAELSDKKVLQIKSLIAERHPLIKIESINVKQQFIHLNKNIRMFYVARSEREDGYFLETVFDSNLNLIREKTLGSQLSFVDTSVYTLGPKFSSLSDITIQVEKSPMLSNQSLFVDNQSENKISAIGSNLKFDPKDEKFEQVQVFYYLDKLQSWASDKLGVKFTSRIDAEVNVGYPALTNTAFYFQNKIRLGKGDGVVYANIAHDPSIVFHEGFHAVVDGLANLPFEGEGGSINEGYADFYTCIMINRPFLAESSYLVAPFKRTVKNSLKLSEKNGGLYHDSAIVSGLLWQLKEELGETMALDLATRSLAELNHFSQFADFNEALVKQAKALVPEDKKKSVENILKSRGFKYE